MSDAEKSPTTTREMIRDQAAKYLLDQFKGLSNSRETAETVQRIQTAFDIVFVNSAR